jgi:hypothetical protein
MGTWGCFLGGIAAEADHSPPSNAEVKNGWSYTSTPLPILRAWCLVTYRDFVVVVVVVVVVVIVVVVVVVIVVVVVVVVVIIIIIIIIIENPVAGPPEHDNEYLRSMRRI